MKTSRRYSIEQLRACLAAAQHGWNTCHFSAAGMWKASVHSLRDRIQMETFLKNTQVQS